MTLGAAVIFDWGLADAINSGLGAIFPVVFGAALELGNADLVFSLV